MAEKNRPGKGRRGGGNEPDTRWEAPGSGGQAKRVHELTGQHFVHVLGGDGGGGAQDNGSGRGFGGAAQDLNGEAGDTEHGVGAKGGGRQAGGDHGEAPRRAMPVQEAGAAALPPLMPIDGLGDPPPPQTPASAPELAPTTTPLPMRTFSPAAARTWTPMGSDPAFARISSIPETRAVTPYGSLAPLQPGPYFVYGPAVGGASQGRTAVGRALFFLMGTLVGALLILMFVDMLSMQRAVDLGASSRRMVRHLGSMRVEVPRWSEGIAPRVGPVEVAGGEGRQGVGAATAEEHPEVSAAPGQDGTAVQPPAGPRSAVTDMPLERPYRKARRLETFLIDERRNIRKKESVRFAEASREGESDAGGVKSAELLVGIGGQGRPRVFVDGRDVGRAPLKLKLRPGLHEIRLQPDEGYPTIRMVQLAPGAHVEIPVSAAEQTREAR